MIYFVNFRLTKDLRPVLNNKLSCGLKAHEPTLGLRGQNKKGVFYERSDKLRVNKFFDIGSNHTLLFVKSKRPCATKKFQPDGPRLTTKFYKQTTKA